MGCGESHQVAFEPAPWCDELASALARVPGEARPPWYAGEVAAGRLTPFRVVLDGEAAGYVLLAFDLEPQGRELVLVAAVATGRRQGLTEAVLPVLEVVARHGGARNIRFHTTRRGLVVRAARLGYAPEYVMRKAVSGGKLQ